MSQQSATLVSVIVDSIDIGALANNVISHIVKKKEPRVDDAKMRTAGGVCTLSDLADSDSSDEPGMDLPDGGPGGTASAPYNVQQAPSTHLATGADRGQDLDVADSTDYPGVPRRMGEKSRIQAVTQVMLKVADELDRNEEMWSLMGQLDLTKETAYDTFKQVAMGIFSRGISWGKIAVLFMFAAHCVIKAVMSELPNILVMLSSFVAQFFGDWLQQWIEGHGGWDALLSPSKNPALVIVTCVVVGVASGILLTWLYDRFVST